MKHINQLLKSEKAEWKTFGDICKIKSDKNYSGIKKGKFISNKPIIIIPQKASLKKMYFVYKSFWSDDSIFRTEIDEKIVNPKFAFYYLQLENLAKYDIIRGVSNLTEAALKKIPFPVFSLSFQQKIVELLEEFDHLIDSSNSKLSII